MVVCIFAYCFSIHDEMDRDTCRLFHPLCSGITRTCTNHEMEERVLGVGRGAGNPRILASGQRNRFPWNFGWRETRVLPQISGVVLSLVKKFPRGFNKI